MVHWVNDEHDEVAASSETGKKKWKWTLFNTPRLASVERTSAEEYRLKGRNFGTEAVPVEVIENDEQIALNRILEVKRRRFGFSLHIRVCCDIE